MFADLFECTVGSDVFVAST